MITETQSKSTQYFASLDPVALSSEILKRIEDFDKYVIETGRRALWTRSYAFYNQAIWKDARLNNVGEQGELTDMFVNHIRNISTHIINTITKDRPSYQARATNSDSKSQAQTQVANNICEYYDRVKKMDRVSARALEYCLQFGDAYVYQGFDYDIGDPMMADPAVPGKVIKQGDVFHKTLMPSDVIFDFTGTLRNAPQQWYCLREWVNKWDLVEKYPEKAEDIIHSSAENGSRLYQDYAGRWKYPTDYVPIFTFFHDRTAAMPDGRMFTFLDDKCYFIDSPLPDFYKTIPVYRIRGSEQGLSGFGYSVLFDLLPLSEAINGLYSTIITNQSTLGVQNILIPNGSDISLEALRDGLNVINYDSKLGKPEALSLVSTPQEIFVFLGKLEQTMEILSGVNSVARGNPESSLKSGTALALVLSTAIEFVSTLQQSYVNLLEDMGTGLIEILKANATAPRMIEISGISNQSYIKQFSKDDISNVSRVTVEIGNPLSRTTAGKVNIAENLLNSRLVRTPQEYIQVLTTGRLEPLIEGDESELILIKAENETMSQGQVPPVTFVDNHAIHVKEHKSVLASVEARNDENIVNAVLAHIQQHLENWRNADPGLLQLLNEQPPAPIMPPENADPLNPTDSVQQQANEVRPPQEIKNPITKQPIAVH